MSHSQETGDHSQQETKQAKAALSKDLNENGANVQMLFEHLTGAGA